MSKIFQRPKYTPSATIGLFAMVNGENTAAGAVRMMVGRSGSPPCLFSCTLSVLFWLSRKCVSADDEEEEEEEDDDPRIILMIFFCAGEKTRKTNSRRLFVFPRSKLLLEKFRRRKNLAGKTSRLARKTLTRRIDCVARAKIFRGGRKIVLKKCETVSLCMFWHKKERKKWKKKTDPAYFSGQTSINRQPLPPPSTKCGPCFGTTVEAVQCLTHQTGWNVRTCKKDKTYFILGCAECAGCARETISLSRKQSPKTVKNLCPTVLCNCCILVSPEQWNKSVAMAEHSEQIGSPTRTSALTTRDLRQIVYLLPMWGGIWSGVVFLWSRLILPQNSSLRMFWYRDLNSSHFFPRFGALEHAANRTPDTFATFIDSRKKLINASGCLFVQQQNEKWVFCLSFTGWIVSIGWAEKNYAPSNFAPKYGQHLVSNRLIDSLGVPAAKITQTFS